MKLWYMAMIGKEYIQDFICKKLLNGPGSLCDIFKSYAKTRWEVSSKE